MLSGRFLWVVILLFFWTSLCAVERIYFCQEEMPGVEKTLLNRQLGNERIKITLNGFEKRKVRTPKGEAVVVDVKGATPVTKKGLPDIPRLVLPFIVPDKKNMEAKVLDFNYEEFHDVDIAPSKGHFSKKIQPSDVPWVYAEEYEVDEFWPGKTTEMSQPYIMRDVRGQNLFVYPVQYNPVTKVLRVVSSLEIELIPTGGKGDNILERGGNFTTVTREFETIYSNFFFNGDAFLKSYPLANEEGSLLIICYDEFMESMEPFVKWKRTTGRKTKMVPVSEAGSAPAEIKSFVSEYYQEHDDFAFLLLVGDAPDQIPSYEFEIAGEYETGHSDSWYGFLEGNDAYNEVIVGRFSATTIEQVQTQVQKVIHYERELTAEDQWLSRGLGIARNEGAGGGHYGESDYEHMDFIRDSLLNFTYDIVYREYDGDVPGLPNTSAQKISQRINEGVGIINYCNHGLATEWSVAGYNISDVESLENSGELPFIWSVACLNGDFSGQECFAESWMRATHQGEPSGAVGVFMSSISQDWVPPMTAQDEMVTILVEQRNHVKRTFGGISVNGSMAMIAAHGNTGAVNHKTWILFGDPSMKVRTKAPQPINLSYNPELVIGATAFAIQSEHEGAMAALTKENNLGEWVILGTARIQNGEAVIEFSQPLEEPDTLTLAVTGFNTQTYLNEEIIVVPPDGPYLHLKDFAITGQQEAQDPSAAFGETLSFDIYIENIGNQEVLDGEVSLYSGDPWVDISENNLTLHSFDEGEVAAFEGAFMVDIDENIPDQHVVQFRLDFEFNEQEQSMAYFNFPVHAPHLKLTSWFMDDSTTGNDNGIFDPGEIVELHFAVENFGHAATGAIKARGVPLSDRLEFLDPYINLEEIEPGNNASFSLAVMAAYQPIQEVAEEFVLQLSRNKFLFEEPLEVTIGMLPDYYTNEDAIYLACQGRFYDSGGADENYSSNENYVVSFYPEQPGSQLEFVFEEFYLEDSHNCMHDFLKVYDGPNTNFPLLGTWCGQLSPDTLVSDNTHGALTFHFSSGSGNTFPGWAARFGCTQMPLHFESITAYPQQICEGAHSQLSAMLYGGVSQPVFEWAPASSLSNASVSNPVAFPSQTTTYELMVTDGETSHTESITIEVNPSPDVNLGGDFTICKNESLVLHAGEHDSYLWSNGSTEEEIVVAWEDYQVDETDIWVLVTNSWGCTATDSIKVVFESCVNTVDWSSSKNITCYPNPASGKVQLELPSNESGEIKLMDVNGRVRKRVQVSSQSISLNLHGLEPGVYFIVLYQNEKLFTRKITILK